MVCCLLNSCNFRVSFVLFVLNILSKNKKILLDKISYSNHKSYVNTENVPLTGGMLLILSVIFLAYFDNPQNTLIVSLMFLIGFMSDVQIINSTKKGLYCKFL